MIHDHHAQTEMSVPPRLLRQVEQHPYPLLFATISGAHLYGFPSPDSDYDLRGVHLLPLEEVVGLKTGQETVEKSGFHDGLEIDLVTHDARKFFGLLLKKNGYVLEQVLSPLVVHTTPEHAELKEIANNCITPAPRPSLPGLCRNTVEAVPEGKPAARQAAPVRVSSAADRHPSDEDGRGSSQPGALERVL
jgi:predicted nucleotidyltransferase